METTVGTEPRLGAVLENLIHLEHDAISAYESAVNRMGEPALKERLADFLANHQEHVRALSDLSHDLAQTPPTGGDARRIVTKGKVVLADMVGDKAILQAMKSNEEDASAAYARAATHDDITPAARTLFEGVLADERHHTAWFEKTLSQY